MTKSYSNDCITVPVTKIIASSFASSAFRTVWVNLIPPPPPPLSDCSDSCGVCKAIHVFTAHYLFASFISNLFLLLKTKVLPDIKLHLTLTRFQDSTTPTISQRREVWLRKGKGYDYSHPCSWGGPGSMHLDLYSHLLFAEYFPEDL